MFDEGKLWTFHIGFTDVIHSFRDNKSIIMTLADHVSDPLSVLHHFLMAHEQQAGIMCLGGTI